MPYPAKDYRKVETPLAVKQRGVFPRGLVTPSVAGDFEMKDPELRAVSGVEDSVEAGCIFVDALDPDFHLDGHGRNDLSYPCRHKPLDLQGKVL